MMGIHIRQSAVLYKYPKENPSGGVYGTFASRSATTSPPNQGLRSQSGKEKAQQDKGQKLTERSIVYVENLKMSTDNIEPKFVKHGENFYFDTEPVFNTYEDYTHGDWDAIHRFNEEGYECERGYVRGNDGR